MNYEEKRELRLQISQLLADAGMNQGKIKEIIEQEIKNKVDRAVEQAITHLNNQCSTGDYIEEKLESLLRNMYLTRDAFHRAVQEELRNRVIQVILKDVEHD